MVDEGKKAEAWRLVRLALERLYLVAYIRYGPSDFDPIRWCDQTAGYMWDSGTGQIIEQKVPCSGKRLKEILDMTASGAHDKSARGETDLR